MEKIIKELFSRGLVVEPDKMKRLEEELNVIGKQKFFILLKKKNKFPDLMDLYVADMRLSIFFWKHLRRLEIELKAKINNYYSFDKDIVVLIRIVKDEKQKWVISNDFLISETNYVEINENSNDEDKKTNKKIYKSLSTITSNSLKNENGSIASNVFEKMSIGKTISYIKILKDDSALAGIIKKFHPMQNITELRNQISHFQLLSEIYSKADLIEFWNIIKGMSATNAKKDKNDAKFNELVEEFGV